MAVQFRYAFVTDADGLKVIDVTLPDTAARRRRARSCRWRRRHGLYLARTYAYVAAGTGRPRDRRHRAARAAAARSEFNADGAIADARDVKVGMTNVGALRLRGRRRQRPAGDRAVGAGHGAGESGLQPAAQPAAGRRVSRPAVKRSESRKVTGAIARSTRAATRLRCSAAAARGRSISRKCRSCSCAGVPFGRSATIHRRRNGRLPSR